MFVGREQRGWARVSPSHHAVSHLQRLESGRKSLLQHVGTCRVIEELTEILFANP